MAQLEKVKVWDLAVRVFHWSLVAFFVISYITGEELETVHAWSGYVVIGLVVFRIFWGLVGSRYARFSNFIYAPYEIVLYLKSLASRSPKHYLGHNPAGGLMIIIMLLSLAMTGWSGLKAYAAEGHGPLASVDVSLISSAYANGDDRDHDDDDKHEYGRSGEHNDEHENEGEGVEDEFWEETHEFFANFTLLLVFIHIGAVLSSSLLHGENLVRAMITGYKENKS